MMKSPCASLIGIILLVSVSLSCAGPKIRTETGVILDLGEHDFAVVDGDVVKNKIASDAASLTTIVRVLTRVEEQAAVLKADLDQRWGKFTQAENDRVRQLLLTYINLRSALFRMVAYHSSYMTAPTDELRLKSFLVGYVAGISLYSKGISLATMFESSAPGREKLNEPEPIWGVPPDVFNTVYDNITHPGNIRLLKKSEEHYHANLNRLQELGILEDPLYEWMPDHLADNWSFIQEHAPTLWQATWLKIVRDAGESGSSVLLTLQTFFANLAGDTRVWFAKATIDDSTIQGFKDKLQPGDILLVRKNYYVSNGFLPGFWPHAILYVGTPDQLEERGLKDRPWVSKHLETYKKPSRDGNPNLVIEAISEGVVFSSLEEVMHGDFVGVLRPRVSDARKDLAIERAFAHLGKPYDFEFDFFSTDELVCTELVYRAYDEEVDGEKVHLEMERMMGRDTYPAISFVRKFKEEYEIDEDRADDGLPPVRELDFVAYLAGNEAMDQDDFIDTAYRPSTPERKGFVLGLSPGWRWTGSGGFPTEDTAHGLSFSARAGHSLGWETLLLYGFQGAPYRVGNDTAWSFAHTLSLEWHMTRKLFLAGGGGLRHGALEFGPIVTGTLGYELLQGYAWALDLRAVYTLSTAADIEDFHSSMGAMLGLQFY